MAINKRYDKQGCNVRKHKIYGSAHHNHIKTPEYIRKGVKSAKFYLIKERIESELLGHREAMNRMKIANLQNTNPRLRYSIRPI